MTRKAQWHAFIPQSIISLFYERYTASMFRKDLLAGVTVGVIALPLAMAFGIASGLTPEQGLITAMVAGFLISFLGGSRQQIGGPTGAFVVIVYEIVQREGYEGLVVATLIAGVMLVVMGLCRLGTLIKYIPYPLVTGFTTGIAVVLFSSQIKDFLGLKIPNMPAEFVGKWHALITHFSTFDQVTCSLGLGTLGLMIVLRKYFPKIPWGVTAIFFATVVCVVFKIPIQTIGSRYGEIPRGIPIPSLPALSLNFETIRHLFPDAVTIALLAGIESLMSALVADGMSGGKRHHSNTELVAQGIANIGSALFGGIPATGAIARTATNVKTGAQTPVAGMVHAVVVFILALVCAPLVVHIPLAGLAAVLMMVAWNMSEIHHFRRLFKAPLGDIGVLLTAFFLTVFIDLTVAAEIGMVLAAFLFMKKMSALSGVISKESTHSDPDPIEKKEVAKGVEVYEITGPFFFGVADRLRSVLEQIERVPKVFVLRLRHVPVIDATGMHALTEFCDACARKGTHVVLSGVQKQLEGSLKRFGMMHHVDAENIFSHIDPALERAAELSERSEHTRN